MSRRKGRAGASVAALALLLSGCTGSDREPARTQAEVFADGLSSGKLSGVAFTDQAKPRARRWWRQVREGMGDSGLTVRVLDVREDGDRATATLGHSWNLADGAHEWSYETAVDLVHSDDGWRVALKPSAVAPDLRAGERLAMSETEPERGDILGAQGSRLVTERPVFHLGIDKTQVGQGEPTGSARALARLVGIDGDQYADRVAAAGDQAFVEAIVLRSGDMTPRIERGVEGIRGARALPDELPLAPTREFARAILGTVGPVTAEIIEDSEGAYEVGDLAGLSGLQQRYDDRLRGEPGVVVQAVDTKTDAERTLFQAKPLAGRPLKTSLDQDLQLRAERLLAEVAPASALVAIRPSTGGILVAATGPGSAGYPTATVGQYAPGSTFKVVTSLALLRAGLSPASTVRCPRAAVVDGKRFENYSDYPASALGTITLERALAQSCNTAFIGQRDRVTPQDVSSAAESLGLGVDHDLGFPAYFGSVPDDVSGTAHAAGLIGQGQVLASPMAMAAVAASVSSGRTVVPHLLEGDDPDADPAIPLTEKEADQLRRMTAAVVGQGSGSVLRDVPGPRVLAKTGTAEFGSEDPPRTHAWMIAAQGDLAVAVFVEVGDSGSRTAGPVLERFLRGAR